MIAAASRFASLALLVALAPSTAAQTPWWPPHDEAFFDKQLSELHIDEITEDVDGVAVRAGRMRNDGQIVAGNLVKCWRGTEGDMFARQDLELKTDDRWRAKRGACDALLAAARRRKEAQGR